MVDDIDSMLGLPKMEGGAIDRSFSVMTLDEILDKKTDVQTVPIIMTEKTPTGTRDFGDLSSFLLSTGLQVTDILGLNGEAVRKLINTPSEKVDAINPKLFLVKNLYEGVDELVEKQVVFISLFHHLFFLAKLAKTADFPSFTDSFANKFAAVQKGVQEIKGDIKIEEAEKSTVAGAADISTEAGFDSTSIHEGSQGAPVSSSIFGVSFSEIAKFWNELNTKITLAETIEIFKKSPGEIYDWFVLGLAKPSAAPAAAPAPAAAVSTEVNTSEVKAEGATAPALGTIAEESTPESKEVNTSEVKATGATTPALGTIAQEPAPESKEVNTSKVKALGVIPEETPASVVSANSAASSKKSPASVIPEKVVSPNIKKFIDEKFAESGRSEAPPDEENPVKTPKTFRMTEIKPRLKRNTRKLQKARITALARQRDAERAAEAEALAASKGRKPRAASSGVAAVTATLKSPQQLKAEEEAATGYVNEAQNKAQNAAAKNAAQAETSSTTPQESEASA